ncbi:GNAT family N-acetyltransferase [Paucibacter sp. TC2R-5]|uniref:GNAT family N-acetyltransferase n=1 Tax=Paucibacter sp. TC2R-5 TaxID=2893555 RepID=UPI0021E4EFC6|nr:GNAT family N-acetyltransferase [Paucibacter sp. TC2R-5]MCV2358513.1 GNAT family N-acetyltransferase [Paucibacter sp. TC2R-5]
MNPSLADLALRAEQAGLNASAPPQEKLIEGWLIRLSPGKAKRSRCINALAAGSLPLDELLARCQTAFAAANLPLYVRVTPYSQPADLDERLAAKGWPEVDAADVMVLAALPAGSSLPADQVLQALEAPAYAQLVGHLRASSDEEIAAHAERQQASPVAYQGFALRSTESGAELLACGQFAREGGIVGLFDIFTPPAQRGRGHALNLCRQLLQSAAAEGAHEAYLQVGSDNFEAQRVYARLGFSFAYRYHYRSAAISTP